MEEETPESLASEDYIIDSRPRDLGGFSVHRSLPSPRKRQLGPFVFLDHMGPLKLDAAHALDVRPHPHIGLATVTYLFEGRGVHRDSLGSVQVITPGDLNWMTAGKGIVHSERTPAEDRDPKLKKVIHGVQIWVGLPKEHEDCNPTFVHWPQDELPQFALTQTLAARLMIGRFQNYQSPVEVLTSTLFMDVTAKARTQDTLSFSEKELGIFLVSGSAIINGLDMNADDLIVIQDPTAVKLDIAEGSRLIIIGGEPFLEPRYIWWNFVSTSKEKIRTAAKSWKAQTFGNVPGEVEFIPLPETPLP